MSNNQSTEYMDAEPLSNHDLVRMVAKDLRERGNIIDTTKPETFNSFDELWKGRGHCILFENPDNGKVGHWTVLTRQKGKGKNKPESCLYFDSYGGKLKDENVKRVLATKYNHIEYNPHRLQEYDTNLCGFYAFIICALNKVIPNLNMHKILSFFNTKDKKDTYDQFIYKLSEEMNE